MKQGPPFTTDHLQVLHTQCFLREDTLRKMSLGDQERVYVAVTYHVRECTGDSRRELRDLVEALRPSLS